MCFVYLAYGAFRSGGFRDEGRFIGTVQCSLPFWNRESVSVFVKRYDRETRWVRGVGAGKGAGGKKQRLSVDLGGWRGRRQEGTRGGFHAVRFFTSRMRRMVMRRGRAGSGGKRWMVKFMRVTVNLLEGGRLKVPDPRHTKSNSWWRHMKAVLSPLYICRKGYSRGRVGGLDGPGNHVQSMPSLLCSRRKAWSHVLGKVSRSRRLVGDFGRGHQEKKNGWGCVQRFWLDTMTHVRFTTLDHSSG